MNETPQGLGKKAGWFSRRYQNDQAHLAAQAKREARVQKWEATIERNAEERAKRTPQQQIKVLDKRLGKGVGAKRERKRLAIQIKTKKGAK